jgi:transposase InsO family protein
MPSPEAEAFLASTKMPPILAKLARSNESPATIKDWHERLGHVSKDALIKYGPTAFSDLDLPDVQHNAHDEHQCEACIYGKHHRLPFNNPQERRNKPLELVHSDLAECNIESLGGGKYVLTFIDDCTRYCRTYILPNKTPAKVLAAFKEYKAWGERQSGHLIKELRTDRGGEYLSDMVDYVKSIGIEHKPMAGHSPQSNGIAERMNRTLFEKASTMLEHSGAPLEL